MSSSSRSEFSLVDMAPVVDVNLAEYARLLGYPPGRALQGRVADLAAWARQWYSVHGRPWMILRETDRVTYGAGDAIVGGGQRDALVRDGGPRSGVGIDGVPFTPVRLARMLRDAQAHAVIVAAVSAGPELEAEAQQLWRDQKPDEYFFLEAYGSAVVEHLAMAAGARLCAWAEARGMAVLPHDSPGYDGWDIAEQPHLLPVVAGGAPLPGSIRTLDSGALVPKKSLLAVYGLTRHAGAHGRVASMVPCDHCALAGCQFRRRPYRLSESAVGPPAGYRTNRKALQRWAKERLTLTRREDGGIDARFRYDGTTCTNMGRELSFVYEIALGPREAGYPILAQRCAPAPGATGHEAMCGYLRDAPALMAAIEAERPLSGGTLGDVLSWPRPVSSAGCYCDAASREHKWGLVFETIHYALAEAARET